MGEVVLQADILCAVCSRVSLGAASRAAPRYVRESGGHWSSMSTLSMLPVNLKGSL
jgi:hypothetical protein